MKSFSPFIALLLAVASESALTAQADAWAGPDSSVVFVAHRGGIVPEVPENTLAAFRNAMAQGAAVIEIDLRATKDGEIVVLHDETLERTTNGRGRVEDHTLADLETLDAGQGERIPTYDEVLRLVAGTPVRLLLDIKPSPALDRARIVRLTEAREAVGKVIVGVRSLEDLRAFRALNPELRLLGFVPDVEAIESFIAAGVDIVRLWPDWIASDPGWIEQVQGSGTPVWVTVGAMPREELITLLRRGVDGVLLDDPALARILSAEMQ